MECREYEKQIQSFLMDELEDDAMTHFIEHVQGCPRCYEELEVYHSVYDGLDFMHDEDVEENDMESSAARLAHLIESRKQRIHKKHVKKILVRVALGLVILAILGIGSCSLMNGADIWQTGIVTQFFYVSKK